MHLPQYLGDHPSRRLTSCWQERGHCVFSLLLTTRTGTDILLLRTLLLATNIGEQRSGTCKAPFLPGITARGGPSACAATAQVRHGLCGNDSDAVHGPD